MSHLHTPIPTKKSTASVSTTTSTATIQSTTQRRQFLANLCLISFVGLTCVSQVYGKNIEPSTTKNILIMGDSLTAEYGLSKGTGWASLLNQRLQTEKKPYQIINASISGDTTSGGLSRLANALSSYQPKIVIIALGGNDMLRGFPQTLTEQNLRSMVTQSQAAHAKVLLLRMQAPPNYGKAFQQRFDGLYTKIAQEFKLPSPPFLLDGFATKREWFQQDNIHPNASAQPTMLNNVWPSMKNLLDAQ